MLARYTERCIDVPFISSANWSLLLNTVVFECFIFSDKAKARLLLALFNSIMWLNIYKSIPGIHY